MGKLLSFFSVLFFMSNLQAQSIQRLSQQVDELVSNYANELERQDKRQVRRHLRQIKDLFADYGYYPGDGPDRDERRLFCNSGNNALIDLTTTEVIYDFGTKSNCEEALVYVQNYEPFCDYGNNKLFSSDPVQLIHDFGTKSNCQEGREAVLNKRPFCDYGNNALYTYEGVLIYDFGNKSDCQEARDRY